MKKLKKILTMIIVAALLFSAVPFGSVPANAKKTVKVTSIKLNKSVYTLKKGKTFNLKVTYNPSNTTQKKIVWKSSNKKIVTVSKKGKIKAKKNGKATITATVKGTKKKAACKVYVGTPVTGISTDVSSKTLEKGKTYQLKAKALPAKATVKTLKYSSSNTNVATVSKKGLITAKGAGTCNITVSSTDGTAKTKTVKITVEEYFTVRFLIDGKDYVPAKKVKSGSKITLPKEPSESGKIFFGWYLDKAFEYNYYDSYTITSNTVLYGKLADDVDQKPSTTITSDDFAFLSADKTEFSTDEYYKDITFSLQTSLVSDDVYVLGSNGDRITLNDAGNDGDVLAKDGVYTGSYYLEGEEENLEGIRYTGYAEVGTQTLESNQVVVSIIEPFSDEEIDLMSDFDEDLVDFLASSEFQAKGLDERETAALAYLKAQEGTAIVPGSITYDSNTYCYQFEYLIDNGISGKAVIYEKEDGTKGRSEEIPLKTAEKKNLKSALKTLEAEADDGEYKAEDKKNVLVLHNFSNPGSSTSSAEQGWISKYNEYVSGAVGSVSNINTITGTTVETYKNLDNYDAIIINSHGSYDSSAKDPELCLRQIATADLDREYDFDIQKNRVDRAVCSSGTYYWLRPAFFTHYYPNAELSGTIVYLGCCLNYGKTTIDQDMAKAWHTAGADAIYAYLNSVDGAYDYKMLQTIFTELAAGKSTSSALSTAKSKHGADDGGNPAAVMYLYETSDTYFINGLQNGGFDGSNNLPSLAKWTRRGDVRAISSIGGITPKSAPGMAIISTGIGSEDDETTSCISQAVRVPSSASKITYKYDMISEEPMEYVGSIYNDNFKVQICDTDGNVLNSVGQESINASTWYSLTGIDFPGGDETTYHTRWKEKSIDISAYRGKIISLKFVVEDVGDSIYDSAVVLDDVAMK